MRFLSSLGRHKLFLGSVFLFVLGFGLFGYGHSALAQDPAGAAAGYINTGLSYLILTLANILQILGGYIGKLALSLIEMIVVPILQYNSFSSSPTVGLGWSLVRDVVNMFVVLVLLVIAIATIVGYEKVSWQKNLPQFLMAVVLVNFSRTICGILIDLSQVVMFTFVNALLDVAAGNFANLTGMDVFGQYSNTAVRDATGNLSAIDAAEQLGAAYILFVLYACIFAVILLLALVYIWRIIMLWVLVILSPLTFFTWGLGGMFKFAAGSSADWWKKFTSALVIGPMLTFFLWLALSTATGATGDIVADEGFHAETTGAVSQTLVSFETSQLLSTFLGLVLLIVGMQQSAATANSMGGLAKKALGDEKLGQKLVGGVIRRAGGNAVIEGGYTAARNAARGAGKLAGYGIQAGSAIGSSGAPLAALAGKQMVNGFGGLQQKTEAYAKSGKEAADKRLKNMTTEQKVGLGRIASTGGRMGITASGIDDFNALRLNTALSGKQRKQNKEHLSVEENDAMNVEAIRYAEANKGSFDDAQKQEYTKLLLEQAHLAQRALGDDDGIKALIKLIDDPKFNPRDLSPEVLDNPKIRQALENKTIRTTDDGKRITALSEMDKGTYGEELKAAARGGAAQRIYSQAVAGDDESKNSLLTASSSGGRYSAGDIAANIDAKRIKVDSLSVGELTGVHSDALVQGLLQSRKSPAEISDIGARNAYQTQATTMANTPGALTPRQTATIDAFNLSSPGAVLENIFDHSNSGSLDEQRVVGALKRDQNLVAKFRGVVSTPSSYRNSAQDAIVDAMTAKQAEDLEAEFHTTADPIRAAAIADSVEAMARSIEGYIQRMGIPAGTKLKDVDKETDAVYKRVRRAARAMAAAGVTPPPPNL